VLKSLIVGEKAGANRCREDKREQGGWIR
jgi:hypothetical protein